MDARTGCQSHKDLIIWQKSLDLAQSIYQLTLTFPRHELFGLAGQLRRAAVSVSSNIAEGSARRTTRDFAHILYIARGSLAEVETQLLIAKRIGYLDEATIGLLMLNVDEIGRMLTAILAGLQRRLTETTDGEISAKR